MPFVISIQEATLYQVSFKLAHKWNVWQEAESVQRLIRYPSVEAHSKWVLICFNQCLKGL